MTRTLILTTSDVCLKGMNDQPHDYDKLNRLCRKHKAALTRAKKKSPEAVIAAVDQFYADFEAADAPLPDNWRLWEVAKEDAQRAIQLRPLQATSMRGGQ